MVEIWRIVNDIEKLCLSSSIKFLFIQIIQLGILEIILMSFVNVFFYYFPGMPS